MARKVVLDVDEADMLIQNDLPVDTLYPKHWNKKLVLPKDVLLEGEKVYYYNTSKTIDYALTSKGRLFNVQYIKQLLPTFFLTSCYYILRGQRVSILDDMSKYLNIDISRDELLDRYNKHKWSYLLYDGGYSRVRVN